MLAKRVSTNYKNGRLTFQQLDPFFGHCQFLNVKTHFQINKLICGVIHLAKEHFKERIKVVSEARRIKKKAGCKAISNGNKNRYYMKITIAIVVVEVAAVAVVVILIPFIKISKCAPRMVTQVFTDLNERVRK